MKLIKSIPFEFDKKEYETKIFLQSNDSEFEYIVKIFLDNRPVNGFSYSVTETTKYDFELSSGDSALKYLIERAQNDVKENIWEKYHS